MSGNRILEDTLKEILVQIKPSQDDWLKRFQVVEEVREIVLNIARFRGATVEAFGSFASNLFSKWGDLDISIQLDSRFCVSSVGKKLKQNLLREIRKALKARGGWSMLQLIPYARVPILKFDSSNLRISCDVSIDNLMGQMKSKVLLWINEIDARFRDMVLLVKEWAKAHDINNSKSGTFNSYTLSLLVIFHFQTCVPAILPPLNVIYPGNMVEDLRGVRDDVERRIAETCAANITSFRTNKSRAVNHRSLSELFISFLAKFSDISLKASELGICTYVGQWQDINSNMRWLPKTYALFVEDPFEQPENTARAVSKRNLTRISEAFQMTHNRLVSVDQDKRSLLDKLVKPHISQVITTQLTNPRFDYGYYRPTYPETHTVMAVNPNPQTLRAMGPAYYPLAHRAPPPHLSRPQVYRAIAAPTHPQYQFQSIRSEGHNNSASRNPSQARHNQGQQSWRPRSD